VRCFDLSFFNRVGVEGAFEYCGLSCVTGPDGIDIARAGSGEELIFVELSKDAIARVRKSLSHLHDRRSNLYS